MKIFEAKINLLSFSFLSLAVFSIGNSSVLAKEVNINSIEEGNNIIACYNNCVRKLDKSYSTIQTNRPDERKMCVCFSCWTKNSVQKGDQETDTLITKTFSDCWDTCSSS